MADSSSAGEIRAGSSPACRIYFFRVFCKTSKEAIKNVLFFYRPITNV